MDPMANMPIGKMVLSPTRTYLPLAQKMLQEYRGKIKAMIHCTGGGQTKVLKFARAGHIVKDQLFETPRLFRLIQAASGASLHEMYRVFNMGHLLEVYTDAGTASALVEMAETYGIAAKVVGRVEPSSELLLTIASGKDKVSYKE
jgi:phosphoribosylformylglycinamidine cyclo-ligase